MRPGYPARNSLRFLPYCSLPASTLEPSQCGGSGRYPGRHSELEDEGFAVGASSGGSNGRNWPAVACRDGHAAVPPTIVSCPMAGARIRGRVDIRPRSRECLTASAKPIIVHETWRPGRDAAPEVRIDPPPFPGKPMTLPASDDRNAAEIAFWNGPGGQRWLNRQQAQDALLAPVTEVLLDRAAARVGEIVLDIGCGCGSTSIALAQCVAPGGRVLGIDVSAPMLERARQLTPKGLPVDFALADATVYALEPGGADLLFSRFGVMFFADPAESFANMRCGLRSGARLVFGCWREPRENPWLLLPLQEAYRHVPR